MRKRSGDLLERLVGGCGDVAYQYVDLFAFDLGDETLLVVFPVVGDGFDLVRPPFEVAVVEKAQDIVQIEQAELRQFFL